MKSFVSDWHLPVPAVYPIRSDWQSLGSNIYLGYGRLIGEVERKLIAIWNSQDEEHQKDAVMQHKRSHSQNIDYILANKDYMKPMETS